MKLPLFWQQLPSEIKVRFGQKRAGRQRAMVAEGHLLLVLHKTPQPDSQEREGVFFWRKPDGSWDSSQGGGLARLRDHIEEYESAQEKLSREYDQAQDAEDYFKLLEKITPLQHSTGNLYTTLQAAREAIAQDRDLIDLRDWAYDLDRTLDLLYMSTRHALDYQIARQSEKETRLSMQSVKIANRLNVLAAIFFPLTAISGIFGMNLRTGLEGISTWLFWLVLLLGILLGFGLSWWVLSAARGQK